MCFYQVYAIDCDRYHFVHTHTEDSVCSTPFSRADFETGGRRPNLHCKEVLYGIISLEDVDALSDNELSRLRNSCERRRQDPAALGSKGLQTLPGIHSDRSTPALSVGASLAHGSK